MQAREDIGYTVEALKMMGKYFDKSVKFIVQKMALGAKKRIKANMYQHTGRVKGWLREHVYSVKRQPTMYAVSAPRHVSEPNEKGTTINIRRKKWLIYKTKDGWRKTKSVQIPARRWFTRSYDGFEESSDYKNAVEKGLQLAIKEFDKAKARGVI